MALSTIGTNSIADDAVTVAKATGFGKIGQVIQAVKTDTTTINSQTFTTISSLSLNITPTATSSKILLMMSVTGAGDMSAFRFLRGSTPIGIGGSASNRPQVTASSPFTNDNKMFEIGMNFLDSPNSTSQLTFVVQSRNLNSGNNAKIGQSVTDTDNNQHPRTISTLTAMEILA